MTPEEAADLAAGTLTAIDHGDHSTPQRCRAADRERVASDLAGLREHAPVPKRDYSLCSHDWADSDGWVTYWPCPDAARYADSLRRTAALYGVTS